MLNIENHSKTIELLSEAGIRLSHQRMAILQYLMEHHTHPSVAEIYDNLHPLYPTLSRTTVYNTLKLLVESGAVMQLDIEPGTARYDADLSPHAHFICRSCGQVFDVPVPEQPIAVPQNFSTESVAINYRGLCPMCAAGGKN